MKNGNETWLTLAAATAMALNSDEQQNENADRDGNASEADKQRAENQRRYVEQRLRELAIWERRIAKK